MSNIEIYMNTHLWSVDVQPQYYPLLDQLKEIGYDGIEFYLGSPQRADYVQLGLSLIHI